MRELTGLDSETRELVLQAFRGLAEKKMPLAARLEWDRTQEFPVELIRELLSEDVGLHLVLLPEAYGGLGGGACDIALVCEEMGRVDLGVATAFLAISLGADPIIVGGTAEQKDKWLSLIAAGRIVAYAATEPDAGSDLRAIKTTADRILDAQGKVTAYRINGTKQFISNGGYADIYTLLAKAPDGPSFFVVEQGVQGLKPGKSEDKHGIRCSNTSPVIFENMVVPAESLVGGVEGQGLSQANEVFGYTRLMVAALGLGAGVAAMEKAMAFARDRKQFGRPLSALQGYTHKLIVPHAVRLEAARAYIEHVAQRLDGGDEAGLQVEGSIAKYFATEAGNAAAEAGLQALGGYGYMREYEVEKIKRDVKITTIYEGTSEIQQNIIGMLWLRPAMRGDGALYAARATELEGLGALSGGPRLAAACTLLRELLRFVRQARLTRQQYALFLLADMFTHVEVGLSLCRKAAAGADGLLSASGLEAASRLFATWATELVHRTAAQLCFGFGAEADAELTACICRSDVAWLHSGALADMQTVAEDFAERTGSAVPRLR